jgi:hypothetical protein
MQSAQGKTYLRVGGDVFPVYGDELRGWSPRAADFGSHQAAAPRFVYGSLDELYFVLVNLCTSREYVSDRSTGT